MCVHVNERRGETARRCLRRRLRVGSERAARLWALFVSEPTRPPVSDLYAHSCLWGAGTQVCGRPTGSHLGAGRHGRLTHYPFAINFSHRCHRKRSREYQRRPQSGDRSMAIVQHGTASKAHPSTSRARVCRGRHPLNHPPMPSLGKRWPRGTRAGTRAGWGLLSGWTEVNVGQGQGLLL